MSVYDAVYETIMIQDQLSAGDVITKQAKQNKLV